MGRGKSFAFYFTNEKNKSWASMRQILAQLWVSWPSHFTANRQSRRQSVNPSPGQEGCLQQRKGDEMGSPPEEQANPQAILPASFLETTFGQAGGEEGLVCNLVAGCPPGIFCVISSSSFVCCQTIPLPPRDELWLVVTYFRDRRTR